MKLGGKRRALQGRSDHGRRREEAVRLGGERWTDIHDGLMIAARSKHENVQMVKDATLHA